MNRLAIFCLFLCNNALPAMASPLSPRSMVFEDARIRSGGEVEFLARGDGYHLFLSRGSAVVALQGGADSTDSLAIRLRPVGAHRVPSVEGLEKGDATAHYLLASGRYSHASLYRRVKYSDVYPGVDMVYYGNQRRLEYDFVVAPCADPAVIEVAFDGVDSIEIDQRGDLLLHTASGTLRQSAPVAFQEVEKERRRVACAFVRLGPARIGFCLGVYDRTLPLVIDPILAYASYFGGKQHDFGNKVLVDGDGFIYLMGTTWSQDFPIRDALYPAFLGGTEDVFITKLTPDGQNVVFSTYLGGNSGDTGSGFSIGADGCLYVGGGTFSSNFPTVNAIQGDQPRRDAFLTKISSAGDRLLYSTYLGGEGDDTITNLVVSPDGTIWVTGETRHESFPTYNSSLVYGGGPTEAFAARFAPDGSLLFSTFLGGSRLERGHALAADAAGNIFVVGETSSSNFPVTESTPHQGGADAFVVKFDATGTLAASLLYGGARTDRALAAAVNSRGELIVAGSTSSVDLDTRDAMQSTYGGGGTDAFVMKLRGDDLTAVTASYLGGEGADVGTSVTMDSADRVCLTLDAGSGNLPLIDPLQGTYGGGTTDGYVAIWSPDCEFVEFSTYLGGSGDDRLSGLSIGARGKLYSIGSTTSRDLPTASPVQAELAGQFDSFVVTILSAVNETPWADPTLSTTPVIAGGDGVAEVVLDGSRSTDPDGDPLTHSWFLNDALIARGPAARVTFPIGAHDVQLVVSDGVAEDVGVIRIEVMSASDASDHLLDSVETSSLSPGTSSTLESAIGAFETNKAVVGVRMLHAFQNKIRAQIGKKIDPELGEELIRQAQEIIDATAASAVPPRGRKASR